MTNENDDHEANIRPENGKDGNSYGTLDTKAFNGSKVASVPRSAAIGIGIPIVCMAILVVELCERLAFYSFTGTQEFFLEKVGYSLAQASSLNATMSTLCMAWTVFAGWCADALLGRYWTILAFGVTYVAGAAMAAAAAIPSVSSSGWYLIGIMGLVPLGTAGIKSNIANFGADQYDESDPDQLAAQETFFNWFYLSINIGSAVAYGYLTTLATNGGLGIPQEHGYFAVYTLASIAMLLGVAVFASFRRHYRIANMQETSALVHVAREACSSAFAGASGGIIFCMSWILLFLAIGLSVVVAFTSDANSWPVSVAASVCAIAGVLFIVMSCTDPTRWVNVQTQRGKDIAEFLRLLPVLFTGCIAFSSLYNAMQFWYQQQACQMDLRVSRSGAQLSGSFFMIADCLGIVVATPLAIGVVNPMLERWLGPAFGHGAKFGVGMAMGGASVLVAIQLELTRRASDVIPEDSHCAPQGIRMSDLQAAWMTVPFFLTGLGEVYTQPTLMYLAYSCSPAPMRTLAMVTFLLIQAVSDAIFTVQVSVFKDYVPNDLNQGHLEYGYMSCLALGLLLFGGFLMTWKTYEDANQSQELGVHSHMS